MILFLFQYLKNFQKKKDIGRHILSVLKQYMSKSSFSSFSLILQDQRERLGGRKSFKRMKGNKHYFPTSRWHPKHIFERFLLKLGMIEISLTVFWKFAQTFSTIINTIFYIIRMQKRNIYTTLLNC